MEIMKNRKFVFTVFGASGDLAFLKIFPSIYELYSKGHLDDNFWVCGFARSNYSDIDFRKRFSDAIVQSEFGENLDQNLLDKLLEKVFYVQGLYGSDQGFEAYKQKLKEVTNNDFDEEIFHFSTPPEVYSDIVECIERNTNNTGKIRLIFEKPFGQDYETALKLSHYLGKYFEEDSVYLLDHYLGKTQVRSLLELRERNKFLSDITQGKNIEKVIVKALEDNEVENRLGYYDQVGATRDMIQSHLLQLLALLMMRIPVDINTESLNNSKTYILKSLKVDKAFFGQYENYCQNKDYVCSPFTETLVAIKLFLNIDEWFQVPIFLVTGKALKEKETSVRIKFKNHDFTKVEDLDNSLEFEIYPKSEIKFKMIGSGYKWEQISLKQEISSESSDDLTAHAVLLLEAIKGDKKYFLTFEQALACWKITEEILDLKKNVFKYKKSSNESVQKNIDDLDLEI